MTVWLVAASVLLFGAIAYMARGAFGFGASPDVAVRHTIRDMVAAQRVESAADMRSSLAGAPRAPVSDENFDAGVSTNHDQLTLQKRLKYAQLSEYPPYLFAIAQIVLSVAAFLLVRPYCYELLQIFSLSTGPLLVNGFITLRINNRVNRFDKDFPAFLLSFVGMLKTGLNPLQALDACASNLEPNSLVRQEVELMLERLRLGVSEERSIGSFGEDINHPEIELFVQSLLLSRRVGGNLSETIDRLARQTRKRQRFRAAAKAAVAMQRGSILFILAILVFLEVYLYIAWPECVITTWTHPSASKGAQFGLAMILTGLYWVMQVTKIKV
jgi:Flp pilus assembly protein TadB